MSKDNEYQENPEIPNEVEKSESLENNEQNLESSSEYIEPKTGEALDSEKVVESNNINNNSTGLENDAALLENIGVHNLFAKEALQGAKASEENKESENIQPDQNNNMNLPSEEIPNEDSKSPLSQDIKEPENLDKNEVEQEAKVESNNVENHEENIANSPEEIKENMEEVKENVESSIEKPEENLRYKVYSPPAGHTKEDNIEAFEQQLSVQQSMENNIIDQKFIESTVDTLVKQSNNVTTYIDDYYQHIANHVSKHYPNIDELKLSETMDKIKKEFHSRIEGKSEEKIEIPNNTINTPSDEGPKMTNEPSKENITPSSTDIKNNRKTAETICALISRLCDKAVPEEFIPRLEIMLISLSKLKMIEAEIITNEMMDTITYAFKNQDGKLKDDLFKLFEESSLLKVEKLSSLVNQEYSNSLNKAENVEAIINKEEAIPINDTVNIEPQQGYNQENLIPKVLEDSNNIAESTEIPIETKEMPVENPVIEKEEIIKEEVEIEEKKVEEAILPKSNDVVAEENAQPSMDNNIMDSPNIPTEDVAAKTTNQELSFSKEFLDQVAQYIIDNRREILKGTAEEIIAKILEKKPGNIIEEFVVLLDNNKKDKFIEEFKNSIDMIQKIQADKKSKDLPMIVPGAALVICGIAGSYANIFGLINDPEKGAVINGSEVLEGTAFAENYNLNSAKVVEAMNSGIKSFSEQVNKPKSVSENDRGNF